MDNSLEVQSELQTQNIENEASYNPELAQELGQLVSDWRYKDDKSRTISWQSPDSPEDLHWDRQAFESHQELSQAVWEPLLSHNWVENPQISEFEKGMLETSLMGDIKAILSDPNYEYREDLIAFIGHDVWFEWSSMIQAREGSPYNLEKKALFEAKREQAVELFQTAITGAPLDQRSRELKVIFEYLYNCGSGKEAAKLLFADNFDNQTRLETAVAYINQFGLIATIDLIANKINSSDTNPQLADQLRDLYQTIEGEEVKNISKELQEIYERVDYSKYALSAEELTNLEVDYIEEHLAQMGKSKEELNIIDVGAGVGRHSANLKNRGYRNVTALDAQQNHIDYMSEHYPDLKTVYGSWNELVKLTGKKDDFDFAYSLGRSLTHNRTPSEMVQAFDQICAVVKPNGQIVVDFEEIELGGERKARVQRLEENLAKLGIQATGGEIFDGPSTNERYNRLIFKGNQMEVIGKALGLKLVEKKPVPLQEGGFNNVYYTFEKDPDFDPQKITPEEFHEYMFDLGLYKPGTDFNIYIEAWGMTIGQARIYVHNFGLGNEYMRKLNEAGKGPGVIVEYDRGEINLESTGMPKIDHLFARATRGMSKDEMENFVNKATDLRENNIISGYDLELIIVGQLRGDTLESVLETINRNRRMRGGNVITGDEINPLIEAMSAQTTT